VSALAAPVAATAPGTSLVAVEEDAMVTIARVDGEMRAASIRQVVELIGRHPEESLTVVRDWLGKEANA
ncbi:MAG: flagellar M-ring protein FliF, partial [Gluconacetobacter diazotrophicus]|nr:flagellar M-ring protein FliF [Gluconacetobacter diazotrophicus]